MANTKSMQRAAQLQIRLNDAEKTAFRDAARINGLSMSDWIRQVVRKAAIVELRSAGKDKVAEALTK